MAEKTRYTLTKQERLCSGKMLDMLFSGKGRSWSSFPIYCVYTTCERQEGEPPVRIVTSVSKRKFKYAVDRNRAKRLLREAYRQNKHSLVEAVAEKDFGLLLGFIWMPASHVPAADVSAAMQTLLSKIASKL